MILISFIIISSSIKTEHVLIFWDLENVPIPRSVSALKFVRKLVQLTCAPAQRVDVLRAYADCDLLRGSAREQLERSGVTLCDAVHGKKGDTAGIKKRRGE